MAGRRGWFVLLFPEQPRTLPGQRVVKIMLRAIHAAAAGILLGGCIFGTAEDSLSPWFAATAISGLAIVVLDLLQTAVFLVQVRGVVVLGKIAALLAASALEGAARTWLLGVLFVVSVASSHATSRIRYFVLVGRGRLRGSQARG